MKKMLSVTIFLSATLLSSVLVFSLINPWVSLSFSILPEKTPSALSIKIITEKDIANFTRINENIVHTGTDACIQKITDGIGVYIIKQINDPSLDEQFLLINDVIASTIGCNAHIAINEVSFIPYNVASHLKMYPERAATLHTYVSGYDLESQHPPFLSQNFILHQRVINTQSIWQQESPLAANEQGLKKIVIESMSVNNDCARICALDTFIGNKDRSNPNIFYNQLTGRFCGIDQAASFGSKLSSLALDRIKELAQQHYFDTCCSEVIAGLRIYQKTLQELYNNNQPNIIMLNMYELVPYLAPDVAGNDDIQGRLYRYKISIHGNYCDTLSLIALLDTILP